jgi:recombination protein RecA
VRKKMNVMFGNDEEIAGGQAPRFYASMIMKVTRVGTIKDSEGAKLANKVTVECVKNQIAPPFIKAEADVVYGKGFNQAKAILVQAEKWGLIEKDGNAYVMDGIKIGKGIDTAAAKLPSYPEIELKLIEAIREKGKW